VGFRSVAACWSTVLLRRILVFGWLLYLFFFSGVSMKLTLAPKLRKAWVRPGFMAGPRRTAERPWSSSSCENCGASCGSFLSLELLNIRFKTSFCSGFFALRFNSMVRACVRSSSLAMDAGSVGAGRQGSRMRPWSTPAFRMSSRKLTLRSMTPVERMAK
jgi:hypothetical protein